MRLVLAASLVCVTACVESRAPAAPSTPGAPDAARGGDANEPGADGATNDGVTPGEDGTARDAGRTDAAWFFEDVTARAGIDVERPPVPPRSSYALRMSGGVCVLDADGQPPLDLFFALGTSSRLYVARSALAYTDRTTEAGLADAGFANGCLAADLDLDGDDDLVLTGVGRVSIRLNDGARFVDSPKAIEARIVSDAAYTSAAAADLDLDGDLDLVVGAFLRGAAVVPGAGGLPPYGMGMAVPNLLLVQQRAGRWVDRAPTLAPDLAREEATLVVVARDFDADGRPDVYVGNDFGAIHRDRVLVREADGVFRDHSDRIGLAYTQRGTGGDTMGFASADFDGNGKLDHIATSFQGDPSAVFICGEDGFCDDQALQWEGTVALMDSFRWGVLAADLDLDGDPDVVEATGHIDTDEDAPGRPPQLAWRQRPNLLLNDRGMRFVPVEAPEGEGRHEPMAARGIAVADLDDDGRPDVVLAPAEGRPRLLRNVAMRRGRWIRIVPRPNVPGTRVVVRAGGRSWLVERVAGEGYLGNFDPRPTFGLGEVGGRVAVQVTWPDGRSVGPLDLAVDAMHVVTAP
ncbi:MAG: CRTAC1 family protein [Myxococcota bacterium]|nr:CRTAC1 family protein [Myxococcota bacterium]